MSFFRYDELIQDSFRGIVKEVLSYVSEQGLPGDHHFYITYSTDHPDVDLPSYLLERHPEEITIVIQHQFWDLRVYEDHFQISLSFNNVKETLRVPYDALISFFDPSVKFGLQFAPNDEDYDDMEMMEEEEDDLPPPPPPSKKGKKAQEPKKKEAKDPSKPEENNVVILDHFRKK